MGAFFFSAWDGTVFWRQWAAGVSVHFKDCQLVLTFLEAVI